MDERRRRTRRSRGPSSRARRGRRRRRGPERRRHPAARLHHHDDAGAGGARASSATAASRSTSSPRWTSPWWSCRPSTRAPRPRRWSARSRAASRRPSTPWRGWTGSPRSRLEGVSQVIVRVRPGARRRPGGAGHPRQDRPRAARAAHRHRAPGGAEVRPGRRRPSSRWRSPPTRCRSSELTQLADETIRRRLESVSGVGQVQIAGGLEREVRVYLQPRPDAGAGRLGAAR